MSFFHLTFVGKQALTMPISGIQAPYLMDNEEQKKPKASDDSMPADLSLGNLLRLQEQAKTSPQQFEHEIKVITAEIERQNNLRALQRWDDRLKSMSER